jgi:RNA polymerase sigma factor (sigma-70 family)
LTVVAESRRSTLIAHGIDFGAVYDEHIHLLLGVAVDRFHISEGEAQTLAHEVFLAYFLKAEDVRDVRAWLLGAICNASRHYLRARARDVALPPEIVEEPDPLHMRVKDSLPDQLAAREAFSCVTARCQLVLRLRYLEGYSIPEIAAELHTTPKYAQNLVTRCLQQARVRYTAKGDV